MAYLMSASSTLQHALNVQAKHTSMEKEPLLTLTFPRMLLKLDM
jgi:hypothetical protein